jgi:phosphoribosylformylglycinamidine synthase
MAPLGTLIPRTDEDIRRYTVPIYRIEVALRPDLVDATGAALRQDLLDAGLERVRDVNAVRVYLVEADVEADRARAAAEELFTDRVAERFAIDAPVLDESADDLITLEIIRKAGVMDPVEQSALRGLSLFGFEAKSVRTRRRILVHSGGHSADEIVAAARKSVANDVIEEIVVGRPEAHPPHPVKYEFKKTSIPLGNASDDELMKISREGGLSLNLAEMKTIRDEFVKLGRDPTDIELETLAQTWSEHCGHKTFRGKIRMGDEVIDNLLKSTVMDVTKKLDKKWCLSVFRDNAGVIGFDDTNGVCFKVETHNHPSAIEPYGGANTGIGGVIRDPLGTGMGAKPVASTDVFCFAPVDYPREKLPPGVLHPKRVMKGVVRGVRDYGNRMGIPTVNGAILFDERYLGNPLVFCGNVGLIPRNLVEKAARPGDRVIVAGGATGRDGIHGATFSSIELTEDSEMVSSGAVQIGNAIEEKKLTDVILKARDLGLYTAITDCGAGGLSSAVGEMGEEIGAEVELSLVPLKYDGLSYTEIWISEAQERMVMAVPPENAQKLIDLFASEDVVATDIGLYTDTKRLVLTYDGSQVCDLPMEFLHEGTPRLERKATWSPPPADPVDVESISGDLASDLARILGEPDTASKEWVIHQYDHEVQAGSALKPLVGPGAGPGDGAVFCPVLTSDRAVVLSCGINPRYGDLDPYRMGASVVDEAVRNAVSCGADPAHLALLDNFCWGNTDRPEVLGPMVLAARGASDAALAHGTPFVSGKDSLNNEYRVGNDLIVIPGTLLISAIGVIDSWKHSTSMDLKAPGNGIFLVGLTKAELGGGAFLKLYGKLGSEAPSFDAATAPRCAAGIARAVRSGVVRSCHDLTEGGLAVAAAEMAFAGEFGLDLNLAKMRVDGELGDAARMFSESNGRYLVEVEPGNEETFLKDLGDVPVAKIGAVTPKQQLRITGTSGTDLVNARLDELRNAWRTGLKI